MNSSHEIAARMAAKGSHHAISFTQRAPRFCVTRQFYQLIWLQRLTAQRYASNCYAVARNQVFEGGSSCYGDSPIMISKGGRAPSGRPPRPTRMTAVIRKWLSRIQPKERANRRRTAAETDRPEGTRPEGTRPEGIDEK